MSIAASDALELTVLMPCLDEERTLGACVERARETLRRCAVRGEVLVADNGSADGSREIAEAAGARVVVAAERGYGAAVRAGILAARGRFVVMGDCDGSYDFGELPELLARLRAGCELVVGNRFRGGIRDGAMPLAHRYLGNPALSALGKLLFRSRCGDVYCGLRGFRRDSVLALGLEARGMEFALEMVVKASQRALSVAEVPVTLSRDGRGRRPHLRTWRDGWRSLRLLVALGPRHEWMCVGMLALALSCCALSVFLESRDADSLVCFAAAAAALQFLLVALLASEFSLRRPSAVRLRARPDARP